MSRLVWVGIGAAGGIYTYRKGQRLWERTKERGVAGTATAAAATAAQLYGQVRQATAEAQRPAPTRLDLRAASRTLPDEAHRRPQARAVTMAGWTLLRSVPGS